jgi:hypothetical protein
VTKLGEGKGGGTTKFICPHCHTTYIGSYTRLRKHLYGIIPWDEGKAIRVKTYEHVSVKHRNKYKEEEATQNKSKKSRVESKSQTSSSQRMFNGRSPSPHASGFSPMHLEHRTISDFLDQGCRDDVDAKLFRFFYACGIPFNVLRSPYWHEMVQPINGAPKRYNSLEYNKARTMRLHTERAKTIDLLDNLQMIGTNMGYPLYLIVGQMLKASHQ